MKFYSLLSEYVCAVPVDYERADGEKCLELLSYDAHTVIRDTVFAELSATLFVSHSVSLYVTWQAKRALTHITTNCGKTRSKVYMISLLSLFLNTIATARRFSLTSL